MPVPELDAQLHLSGGKEAPKGQLYVEMFRVSSGERVADLEAAFHLDNPFDTLDGTTWITLESELSRSPRQAILDEWYRGRLRQALAPLIAKWEPVMRVKVRRPNKAQEQMSGG